MLQEKYEIAGHCKKYSHNVHNVECLDVHDK